MHMMYRFVYIRPSIHRTMRVCSIFYFASVSIQWIGMWWGIIQYCKQHMSSLLITLDWYIIQMTAWDDWARLMHIRHNKMSWVQGNRIDMTHCVHNQQLCLDELPENRELVSLQSTHFGNLKAEDRGWWYIWYVFIFICMTYFMISMCLVFTKHQCEIF